MNRMRIHFETHRDAVGRRAATIVTVNDYQLYNRLCCHGESYKGEYYDGQGSIWFLGYSRARHALADCGIEIDPAPMCTGAIHNGPGDITPCTENAIVQNDAGRTYCASHSGHGGLRIDHPAAVAADGARRFGKALERIAAAQ